MFSSMSFWTPACVLCLAICSDDRLSECIIACIIYMYVCYLCMLIFLGLATFLYCSFLLHSLYLCTANRFSLCLHLVYTVWPLFSSFTAFSLGNHFLLPSTCTLLFGKNLSSISHCDWPPVSSVIDAGKFFGLENYFKGIGMLWVGEVNSCDYTPVIQKRLPVLWAAGATTAPFPSAGESVPCHVQQNVDSGGLKQIWIQWTSLKIPISLKLENCFQSLFNLKEFRQSKILGFKITQNLNFSC